MCILSRAPLRRGSKGLDITVKSSTGLCRFFAPTWDMVMGIKNHTITEAEYQRRYLERLQKIPTKIIKDLAFTDRTFLCYCNNGEFCHTYILIRYLITNFPQWFTTDETTLLEMASIGV